MQCRWVVSYLCFQMTSVLSAPTKMGLTGCPKILVTTSLCCVTSQKSRHCCHNNWVIKILQVITDFIKSEASSNSETSADSDHETFSIKQEEACALQTFPTKITESEVSHACPYVSWMYSIIGNVQNISKFCVSWNVTVTNQNCVEKEHETRLKIGNACYHSLQSPIPCSLWCKNLNIEISKIMVPVVLWKCETWCIFMWDFNFCFSHLLEVTQFLWLTGFGVSYTFMIFVKLR